MYRRMAIVLVALAFLGWHSQVQASPIAITNAGFEAPDVTSIPPYATYDVMGSGPPGWTLLTTGGGGVWAIATYSPTYWTSPTPPEGFQIGWLSVGGGGSANTFSQVLGATLAANTQYTLTGEVGDPIGFPATYTVELLAGGNLLASTSGSGPLGSFASFTLPYSSTGAYLGDLLEIRLSSSGPQIGFDKIALDGTLVPLPSTMLLLGSGLVGLGVLRRKWSFKK